MKTNLFLCIIAIAMIVICDGCSGGPTSTPPPEVIITTPVVLTDSVTNITDTTATLSGNVTADGGATITTRGICWRLVDTTSTNWNPAPTPTDNNIVCDGTIGAYTANVKGLIPATKYNVRAYAINKEGVSYGQVVSFKTTGQTAFTIPGGSITDLETDLSGNVYVTGTFKFDAASKSDIFVAKFNSDGTLAWRKDIVADNFNYPHGGIVVANNIVYIQITLNDLYNIRSGVVYVNAYDCQTGKLKWSTEMSPSNSGDFLVVGGDGYIYSSMGYLIAALDPATGKIARSYTQGGIGPVAVTKDNIFAGGAKSLDQYLNAVTTISELDLNFNTIWSKLGNNISNSSNIQSILIFLKDSLLVTSERYGNIPNLSEIKTMIYCYKLHSNGIDLVWKKTFNIGLIITYLKKYDENNFYVFSPDYNSDGEGPVEMDLKGNVVWTASPKKNGNIAVFNGKVFLADCTDNLKI